MSKFKYLPAVALFCALSPAHADVADEAVAALEKGVPYAVARLQLLQNGWSPAPSEPDEKAETRCGGRIEICQAYPETDACSGTGMGFCLFRFTSGAGAVVSVTTTGEELADLTVHDWRTERPGQ